MFPNGGSQEEQNLLRMLLMQQQQQQQQAQVQHQATNHAASQQNMHQLAQTIALLQQQQSQANLPPNLAPLMNALGTQAPQTHTQVQQAIMAIILQQDQARQQQLQLQQQQQQAQARNPSQQFGALQQQSADSLRQIQNIDRSFDHLRMEMQRHQQQQHLLQQQQARHAAAAAADLRRPSLLGDLPGYSRQQPITLLGGGAASALAAPQISGTGASLLHAAQMQAAAAAAHAAHAAKPHAAPLIPQPSLLGGAQLATSNGAAQDDSDDADDDEAPAIQMEMEIEDEEEAPMATDQSEKISELVKHSGSIQHHLKPKSSISAPNGHGPDSAKEEMNSDSEDEDEVKVDPARSKAWNIFFTQGAIHKVVKEQGNDLYLSIIAENRAKSMEYQQMLNRQHKPPPVLYREPSQAPGIEELMAKIEMNGPDMIRRLRERRKEQEAVKNHQADTVLEAQQKWAESVESWENSPRKKKQDERHREIFERAFPDIKGSRATVAAAARSGWLSAPPAAERVLRGTLGYEDDERMRHGITIPPCQMRPPEGDETFEQGLNETNVIENCFEEHKKRMANWQLKWQVRERNAFKLAFQQNYPKNFCAIAYHLPEKSTRNCVQFYYMTKLDNPSFKICHRQYQNKKRRKATAKPYKPPAMPNACDVASIQASVQDANDRLPPAPVGKQPDLKCSSCGVVMEPSTASTTRITRANLEALGVDAENSRICEKCRVLAANSRGGRCPIKGCTGSKRKVKSSKPFPAEYVRLEENEKKFILEQIEIHIDSVKICHLCAKRIVKEVQRLKQSTDYDDAFAAFCAANGVKPASGAAVVKSEECLSQQDEPAVAAAAAATPTARKGSGRRSEDREEKAWTDDEIARLHDLTNKYGNDWRAIASRMRGRNEEECRLQYVRSTKQSPPPGEDDDRRSPCVKEEVQSMAGSLAMDRQKEEDEMDTTQTDRSARGTTPVPGLVPFGMAKSSASSSSEATGTNTAATTQQSGSANSLLQLQHPVKEELTVKQEDAAVRLPQQPALSVQHTPTIVAPIATHPTQQQQQSTQQQLAAQALQQPMHSVMTSSAATSSAAQQPADAAAAFQQQIIQQHLAAQQQQQQNNPAVNQQLLQHQLLQQLQQIMPARELQQLLTQQPGTLQQLLQQPGIMQQWLQQQQQQQAQQQQQQQQRQLAAQLAAVMQQQPAGGAAGSAVAQALFAQIQRDPLQLRNAVQGWLQSNNTEGITNITQLSTMVPGGLETLLQILNLTDMPEAQNVLRATNELRNRQQQQQQQQQQYEQMIQQQRHQQMAEQQRKREEERARKEKEEREERERLEKEKRDREAREEHARRERAQQQAQLDQQRFLQFMQQGLPGNAAASASASNSDLQQLRHEHATFVTESDKLAKEINAIRVQVQHIEQKLPDLQALRQQHVEHAATLRNMLAQFAPGPGQNLQSYQAIQAISANLDNEANPVVAQLAALEGEKKMLLKKITEHEQQRADFQKRSAAAEAKAHQLTEVLARQQQVQQQAQAQLQQQQQLTMQLLQLCGNDQTKLMELMRHLSAQNPNLDLNALLGVQRPAEQQSTSQQQQPATGIMQQLQLQAQQKEQQRRKMEILQQQQQLASGKIAINQNNALAQRQQAEQQQQQQRQQQMAFTHMQHRGRLESAPAGAAAAAAAAARSVASSSSAAAPVPPSTTANWLLQHQQQLQAMEEQQRKSIKLIAERASLHDDGGDASSSAAGHHSSSTPGSTHSEGGVKRKTGLDTVLLPAGGGSGASAIAAAAAASAASSAASLTSGMSINASGARHASLSITRHAGASPAASASGATSGPASAAATPAPPLELQTAFHQHPHHQHQQQQRLFGLQPSPGSQPQNLQQQQQLMMAQQQLLQPAACTSSSLQHLAPQQQQQAGSLTAGTPVGAGVVMAAPSSSAPSLLIGGAAAAAGAAGQHSPAPLVRKSAAAAATMDAMMSPRMLMQQQQQHSNQQQQQAAAAAAAAAQIAVAVSSSSAPSLLQQQQRQQQHALLSPQQQQQQPQPSPTIAARPSPAAASFSAPSLQQVLPPPPPPPPPPAPAVTKKSTETYEALSDSDDDEMADAAPTSSQASVSTAQPSSSGVSVGGGGQQGGMLLSIFDLDDTASSSSSMIFAPLPPPPPPPPLPPSYSYASTSAARAPSTSQTSSAYEELSSDED